MSGSPDKPNRKRELSDDEAELWSRIAKSTKPLDKATRIIPVGKAAKTTTHKTTAKSKKISTPKTSNPPVTKPVVKKSTPPLAKFDHKKAKKIAKGQDEIDARIDLHGMRQTEAHSALRSFLFRCQSNDQRNVLVITGKGARHKRDESDWFADYEEPGVLKRNLPTWLAEPDMRNIVVSFTEAHARHGGSGAYYVRLRKLGK